MPNNMKQLIYIKRFLDGLQFTIHKQIMLKVNKPN